MDWCLAYLHCKQDSICLHGYLLSAGALLRGADIAQQDSHVFLGCFPLRVYDILDTRATRHKFYLKRQRR